MIFFQREDIVNGGLGISGSNPVIQVAGVQRLIETDPRLLYSTGNFTRVPRMYQNNVIRYSFPKKWKLIF